MSTSKPVVRVGVCAFCDQREQNHDTGCLLKTSDDHITAHYNCMKCSVCGETGATIGCELKRCKKTFHYMCAKNAGAEMIENEDKEIYV
ncbi:hypothetical protein XELAEV_18013604mg [Xenopus laevis]|uniref:PHD-type domain-containing protein n=1 Tax=Xenopus laevis TaxID=8355 RepID=A0A974HZL7_XENLA|nr:hypothetical protein XELAEV_18013604mg [Xenopus laevis]